MKSKGSRITGSVVLSLVILLSGFSFSLAQQYPTRPVNVLLGYGPGGTVDVVFRPLAKAAEKYLGQPLLITNNGAGAGTVALGIAAKEKPDGYHLDVCHAGMLTLVPHLRDVPYKMDEFTAVAGFGSPQAGLGVKADSPWKTIKDVVEYAKKNPGKFTYFGGAPGSSEHMAVEFIAKQEGVQFTMVPFPGGGPAVAALLGGHISAASGSGFLPHARDGSARILVFYTENRVKDFPDVPTLRQLGYNFVFDEVFFVNAPKGTPAPIIKTLQEAFRRAAGDETFIQTAAKMAVLPGYRGADDIQKYLPMAYSRNGKLIKDMNIPREAGTK